MPSLPANARALLEPALDAGETFTWADVEARILNNTAQLWLGERCAIVTELYPGLIHVWLAGGDLSGLMALRPRIEETARVWGCETVTINGRPGWDRLFKPYGYRRVGTELEKKL